MAFPDHNWTITHNANKSYTVSCYNFIEKTKSITLTTANKNFTGDVSINITCANCGAKSISGIASTSAVTVDTSYTSSSTYDVYAGGTMRVNIAESGWIQKGNYDLSYSSYKIGTIDKGTSISVNVLDYTANVDLDSRTDSYLKVLAQPKISITGANNGYYTANSLNKTETYTSNVAQVGDLPVSYFSSNVYVNNGMIGWSADGRTPKRGYVTLSTNTIYMVLQDGTGFWTSDSGTDDSKRIFNMGSDEVRAGSLIFYDHVSSSWKLYKNVNDSSGWPTSPDIYTNARGSVDSERRLSFYLTAAKTLRPIYVWLYIKNSSGTALNTVGGNNYSDRIKIQQY